MPRQPNFQELSFPLLPVIVLSLAFVLLILSISPYYQRQEPILPINTNRKALITPSVFPTPAAYTCPGSEWVNCMPGPGTPNPQCDQSFLNWATQNCPGFKGAAY